MPKRTLPGLGLEAFFDLGENGWNDEFDENFRRLSFMVDGRVLSRTTNLPGTGADGAVYIVPVGQANANQIAIWDGPTGSKAWVYYIAREGWAFYVLDEDKNYQFNGTTWVEFAAAGGGGGGGGGGTPVPAEPVPTSYLQVVKTATQSVPSGAHTVVFESVVEDTDTSWDAASNNIVIPATLDGKVVVINTQAQATANGSGVVESLLEKSTDAGSTWVRVGQSANGGENFFGITSVTVVDRVLTGHRYRLRYAVSSALTLRGDTRCRMTMATLESSVVPGGGAGTPIPFSGFRVRKNADQSLTSGVIQAVTFQTEIFDTEDAFASSVFTVPASLNGKYGIFFSGLRFGSSLTVSAIYLQKSTDGGTTWSTFTQLDGSNQATLNAASGPILLNTGDQFRLGVFTSVSATVQNSPATNFSMAVVDPGISGGGGGGTLVQTFLVEADNYVSGTGNNSNAAFAAKGMSFTLTEDRTFLKFGFVPGAAGQVVKMQVWEVDQTTNPSTALSLVWQSAERTVLAGDVGDNLNFPTGAEGLALESGKSYAVLAVRTNGSGTDSVDIQFTTSNPEAAPYISNRDGSRITNNGNLTGLNIFFDLSDHYIVNWRSVSTDIAILLSEQVIDPPSGGGGGATSFLGLTDTPSAFTGQAGNAVIVNATEDGLEFGLAPGGGGGGGSGAGSSENWAVPWRGATVTMVAQTLDLNSGVILSWDTQVADTDNFWDGAAPTVFTIPAGVTKVRCFMSMFLEAGAISSATAFASFRKNGTGLFVGNGFMAVEPGYNNLIQSLISGVIDVVEGDTIAVIAQFGDSTIPVQAQTFFQIEVVEATDRSALSKLHPFFIPGLPAAGATVYQTVFTEATILKTTTTTELYAGVAATASRVFTLARNGVSVGTITVAAAAQTGTVSVAANVTFNAGDRLSVIAPGTQDATLADVAITLALQLTS